MFGGGGERLEKGKGLERSGGGFSYLKVHDNLKGTI